MPRIRDNRPVYSRATLDPDRRLLAGIVKNAIQDLRSFDPVDSLDALDFLWDDSYLYLLEFLGFDLDPDEIFTRAVLNG